MAWAPSSEFVGRVAEQRMLSEFLVQVDAGAGGLFLVSGEPGIGKSRLAEEAAASAADSGFEVAWGRCREGEGAPPLWPWDQVMRRLRCHVVPLGSPPDPASRFRHFEQITHRLATRCADSPVLIILDDVHRADDISLRMLAFVADQIWPARIGFVINYRDNEASNGLFANVIGGLQSHRLSRSVSLRGLDVGEVQTWLQRERIDGEVGSSAALQERTGGNPLFLSELIRLFRAGRGHDGPPSVRELLGNRVADLPAQTRATLDMAAVLGREFGYAALATALRTSPAAVVDSLGPALQAHVVTTDPARQGGYRFSHALVREAVIDDMGEVRRAELHAVALMALRDTGGAAPGDLAHHAMHARLVIGDETAADFTREAALAADRGLAWEDAARWWHETLELDAPQPQGVHARDRMRLGYALLRSGQVTTARGCFEESARWARGVGDESLLAESAHAVGETVAEVAADDGLIAVLDAALAAAGVAPAVRVRLQARRAMAAYWGADNGDDSRRRSYEALACGELLGDDGAIGAALIARQFTLRGPDHLAARIAVGESAGEIADRLGDLELRFRSHQWLLPDRFQAGDLPGVHRELAAAAKIAHARRDPFQRWWVTIFDGLLAGFSGRDEEAENTAREVGSLGRRLGQPAADVYEVAQLVPMFWRNGRLEELVAPLEKLVPEFPGLPTLECDLLLVQAETGRTRAAQDGLRRLVANDFAALRRDSLFLASLGILGSTAVTLGDIPSARIVLASLAPFATRNLIQGAPVAWGSAAWHLARLAALIGNETASSGYRKLADRLHDCWQSGPWGPPQPRWKDPAGADGLSSRETAVLALLAMGRSNKEIATILTISVHTVERHVANVFAKVGAHNRVEASSYALRHGIGQQAT